MNTYEYTYIYAYMRAGGLTRRFKVLVAKRSP